jgi:hypothetical protein
MKLPLFYKDKSGHWKLFPINEFTSIDGRWVLTYNQTVGCSGELSQFINDHSSKLEWSACMDAYVLKDE